MLPLKHTYLLIKKTSFLLTPTVNYELQNYCTFLFLKFQKTQMAQSIRLPSPSMSHAESHMFDFKLVPGNFDNSLPFTTSPPHKQSFHGDDPKKTKVLRIKSNLNKRYYWIIYMEKQYNSVLVLPIVCL